jgi:hypothetical protein
VFIQIWLIFAIVAGAVLVLSVGIALLQRHGKLRRRKYYHNIELNQARERLHEPLRASAGGSGGSELTMATRDGGGGGGGGRASTTRSRAPSQAEMADAKVNAMYFLRSSSSYSLNTMLPRVGYRGTKWLFMVQRGGVEEVMSMQAVPADAVTRLSLQTEAGREVFRDTLCALRHPFVHETLHVDFLAVKRLAFFFRRWNPKGTLRDAIYSDDPRAVFLSKYRPGRGQRGIRTALVARYGRCILEALAFLDANRVPVSHLHTANLIVHGQGSSSVVLLTDLENSLLGLAPQHEVVSGADAYDPIASFGRVLFEMAMGYALDGPWLELIPHSPGASAADSYPHGHLPGCPPAVFSLLVRILGHGPSRTGRSPSLTALSLLADPFFASVSFKTLPLAGAGAPPDLLMRLREGLLLLREPGAGQPSAPGGPGDPVCVPNFFLFCFVLCFFFFVFFFFFLPLLLLLMFDLTPLQRAIQYHFNQPQSETAAGRLGGRGRELVRAVRRNTRRRRASVERRSVGGAGAGSAGGPPSGVLSGTGESTAGEREIRRQGGGEVTFAAQGQGSIHSTAPARMRTAEQEELEARGGGAGARARAPLAPAAAAAAATVSGSNIADAPASVGSRRRRKSSVAGGKSKSGGGSAASAAPARASASRGSTSGPLPPPPPPPPAPAVVAKAVPKEAAGPQPGRNALLDSIRGGGGVTLKKVARD